MDVDGFVVSLGDEEREFVFTALCCVNPECTCTEMSLSFIEFTPDEPGQGRRFSIELEPEAWEERSPPARQDETQALVAEFISEAPDVLKEALREFRRTERETGRRLLDYHFSSDELGGQDLVPFQQITDPHGSLARGGTAHSFVVTDGNQRFAIDDLYCAAPGCYCEEALLLFFEQTIRDETLVFEKPFAARLPFGKEPARIEGPRRLPPGEGRRLLEILLEARPDLISVLKGRYHRIKELAAHQTGASPSIQARRRLVSSATGRNAPCSCGSGKKHKRCCGR